MNDKPRQTDAKRSDAKGADAQKAAQSREERLKAALKANMAKRKAQARARADEPGGAAED